MTGEKRGNEPEFDTKLLRNAPVECASCHEQYVCTPTTDYYNASGQTNNDGVFNDGQCEPCMLSEAGFGAIGFEVEQ